ncbi:MAG: phosphotriesterase [Deltaproteobacteria bacterium]|nr:phosphotriesterase [Deltaproteobacteria bacterium]
MERINTVTGTCTPDELGRTLVHEHLMVGYPGWQMDALAPGFRRDEAKARAVETMHRLQSHGVKTFLDPCPMDLGRDVELMADVAQASGMRVICTTGAYFEEQGQTYTFRHLPVDDIAAIYEKEIVDGIGETGIRAGLIKIATGAHRVSDYERKLLQAAGRAAVRCDVPLISHTQEGTCGPDQVEILAAEGVPAHRLLVGHSDGIDDPAYHREIVGKGAYIGFDRLGIELILPDDVRVKNIASLVRDGHGRHVCLSHDSVCNWLGRPILGPGVIVDPAQIAQALPNWTPTHLFERVFPKLREAGVPEEAITAMTDENPARWLRGAEAP